MKTFMEEVKAKLNEAVTKGFTFEVSGLNIYITNKQGTVSSITVDNTDELAEALEVIRMENEVADQGQTFEELMNEVEEVLYNKFLTKYENQMKFIQENVNEIGEYSNWMVLRNKISAKGLEISMDVAQAFMNNTGVEELAKSDAKFYRQSDERAIIKKTGEVFNHSLVYDFDKMSFEGLVQGENGVFKAQKIVAEGEIVSAHTRYIVRKQSKLTSI